jgi:DHA1 family inner membrane transport protein
MPIAIFALSLAAFAIGTAEFIIAGVLPNLSADFSVSIPTAGLLVTGYAVAVAIGGPILSVLTTRLPRKPMIVGLLALFALGQAVCALAPSYGWLMAARIFVACSHGLFYGIASVAVADLVPLKKRGTALALFFGGITVANVLGVPGGTAIGNAFGWRWAFWAVGGFAGLATLLVAWLLPPGKRHADEDATLRSELKALTHHHVYLTYLVIAVVSVGAFSFATYQVPLMIAVTGIPQEVAPAFLIIAGIGTVIGIYAGGRATDWKLMPSLLAILLAQAAIATIMLFASRHVPTMVVAIFIFGIFEFAFNAPVQTRILAASRHAPNLAATLVSTAFNFGIALGAWVGGLWIDHGLGYATLPVIGIVCSLCAAAIAALSWWIDRRRGAGLMAAQ